jgi:hypothetical protein
MKPNLFINSYSKNYRVTAQKISFFVINSPSAQLKLINIGFYDVKNCKIGMKNVDIVSTTN